MFDKIWEFVKSHKLLVFLVIVTLVKQVVVSNIPIWALANQLYDDDMMVQMALNILDGKWLGAYTSNTLVKGCFFPLLLVIIKILGLSYISTMNLIYALSCIYFIYTIKDIFKNKKWLGVIYLVLLLNPISYAAWTAQRVYRNGVTISQVLLIVGSMFAIYNKIKEKNIKSTLPYAIFGGIVLGTFWNTREDGIWIIPFVLVVIILTIILSIIRYKKEVKLCVKKVAVAVLPMVLLVVCINIVRLVNYAVYGVFEYNELNDGYFGKAIQALYSIKTDEDIQYVTVTRNKLNLAYEISPTLNSIKSKLENTMDAWDKCDRNPGDGQVEDGWFWWAFKEAVQSAGYYTDASTSNEFYKKVYEEIEQAKEENRIETQATMPAKLMSPWKSEYFSQELQTMGEMLDYVITFDTVDVFNRDGMTLGDTSQLREYEALTNNYALYPQENTYKVGGWYFLVGTESYKLKVIDEQGNILQDVEKISSEDVYNSMKDTEYEADTLLECRFEFEITLEEDITIYLAALSDDGQILDKIELNENNLAGSTQIGVYNFDYLKTPQRDVYSNYSQRFVNILNGISKLYKVPGMTVFIISFIAYIILTVYMFIKRKENIVTTWLLETGIICSILVLVAGVSYNHITACNSKFYMYLSGAYPLLISFCWIAILYVIENFRDIFNKKKRKI